MKGVPQPVVALLEVLLEKDPARRFQNPVELLNALPKVTDAVKARRTITHQSLREIADQRLGASGKAIEILTNLRDVIAARRVRLILWAALVLVIGGGAWWFGYRLHREIQAISEEARHITKEKVRAQLLESVERTRQVALAVAQKSKGWEERERLRQAAEKAYAGSVSRIDELAASFTEIEGTARSSQVFDEMTRILAEQGVDQALAYAAAQQPWHPRESEGARRRRAREPTGAISSRCSRAPNSRPTATSPPRPNSLFTDILALEPDWPDARNAFAWFLIQQGIRIEPAKGNLGAEKAVEICQGTIALNQRGESPQSWAAAQNNLGNALLELGRPSDGEEGRKLLEDALAAYWSALEVGKRADRPQDWATTQNNLGFALYELGIRSDGEEGRKLLRDSVAALTSALEVRTRADSASGLGLDPEQSRQRAARTRDA